VSLRVRAADLAPDLRFAAVGALADPVSCVIVGGLGLIRFGRQVR